MPPKQRITREMILDKTFEMFCEGGLSVVNARSVAKALNCSTQPIFSYYSGMDDLKDSIEGKACETYLTRIAEITGDENRLQKLCNAYVAFAAEYPMVFSHLFMRISGDGLTIVTASDESLEALIAAQKDEHGLTDEQASSLVKNLCVYAHGLAAIYVRGQKPYHAEEAQEAISRMYACMLNGMKA